MDNSYAAQLKRTHRQRFVSAASQTKKCYFIACEKKPIKAHSISNGRILRKLSDNGKVMYMDSEFASLGNLVETGRGIATVFSGFCDEHDKIFSPIDTENYEVNSTTHNYLFAMRAAAKEYNLRESVSITLEDRFAEKRPKRIYIPRLDLEIIDDPTGHKRVFDIGTADNRRIRGIFNDTFMKNKYSVIETAIIELSRELPVAASVMFHMDTDLEGNVINDTSNINAALKLPLKPCFMTIFPQNGKTYCLLSYFKRDKRAYAFLRSLNDRSEFEKEVIVSNILVIYSENFVINPTYWNSLGRQTKEDYAKLFGLWFETLHTPLLENNNFNLFRAL